MHCVLRRMMDRGVAIVYYTVQAAPRGGYCVIYHIMCSTAGSLLYHALVICPVDPVHALLRPVRQPVLFGSHCIDSIPFLVSERPHFSYGLVGAF